MFFSGCLWYVELKLEPLVTMIPDKVRENYLSDVHSFHSFHWEWMKLLTYVVRVEYFIAFFSQHSDALAECLPIALLGIW